MREGVRLLIKYLRVFKIQLCDIKCDFSFGEEGLSLCLARSRDAIRREGGVMEA